MADSEIIDRIIIRNLNPAVNEACVLKLFNKVGKITGITLNKSNSNQIQCILKFQNFESVFNAISQYDGQYVFRRRIWVELYEGNIVKFHSPEIFLTNVNNDQNNNQLPGKKNARNEFSLGSEIIVVVNGRGNVYVSDSEQVNGVTTEFSESNLKKYSLRKEEPDNSIIEVVQQISQHSDEESKFFKEFFVLGSTFDGIKVIGFFIGENSFSKSFFLCHRLPKHRKNRLGN
jgi:hypothetical protein